MHFAIAKGYKTIFLLNKKLYFTQASNLQQETVCKSMQKCTYTRSFQLLTECLQKKQSGQGSHLNKELRPPKGNLSNTI